MTSKPKTVTIPQAEYSALLGVVSAHRADARKSPSKVLEYYDSVTRKPAPEVDRGGRVYYVEDGKVYIGKDSRHFCGDCEKSCDLWSPDHPCNHWKMQGKVWKSVRAVG